MVAKFYTEKRTRWFFRIWSVATAVALISMLDGRYSYIAQGRRHWVTAESEPFEFFSFAVVMALLFFVSTAVGFFSRQRPSLTEPESKETD